MTAEIWNRGDHGGEAHNLYAELDDLRLQSTVRRTSGPTSGRGRKGITEMMMPIFLAQPAVSLGHIWLALPQAAVGQGHGGHLHPVPKEKLMVSTFIPTWWAAMAEVPRWAAMTAVATEADAHQQVFQQDIAGQVEDAAQGGQLSGCGSGSR